MKLKSFELSAFRRTRLDFSFFMDCEQSLFCSKIRTEISVTASVTYERRVEKPRAASRAGIGRRAKRETALVSYNDLDATLTGRIMSTLTPTPNFQYGIPVSNDFSHGFINFARCDEWFYVKEACFEQDEKNEITISRQWSNYGLFLFLL